MTQFSRRALMTGLAGGMALTPFLVLAKAAAQVAGMTTEEAMALAYDGHERLMAIPGLNMHGNEKIAMILYPGFTALDLVGPHYFFACMMGAQVELVTVGETLDPVPSDLQLAIAPTTTLAEVSREQDIVFVPGGTTGTLDAAEHEGLRTYLQSEGIRYHTSVCTGSLILAAAGLLEGKRATGHWIARDALAAFGAIPVDQRVVIDGAVMTGAGVSAGLDFALALVAEFRGQPYAEALRLQAEYDPEPPVPGGSEDSVDPALASAMKDMFAPFTARAYQMAQARSGVSE